MLVDSISDKLTLYWYGDGVGKKMDCHSINELCSVLCENKVESFQFMINGKSYLVLPSQY